MAKRIKLMCIHGLGDHRGTTWKEDWEDSILASFPGQADIELDFIFVTYDPIFEKVNISFWEAARAFWKLTRSAGSTVFGKKRGVISNISNSIKWTAGYVVAWLEDDEFKAKSRKLILDAIIEHKPDVVLAHSLGSLITYNSFTHPDATDTQIQTVLTKAVYITLGSQIGNPFVIRNLTPGRLSPVGVKQWYHLYNEHDDVFTAPIRLWEATNFTQVSTSFDIDGFADHNALYYLEHVNTVEEVWRPISEETINTKAFGSQKSAKKKLAKSRERINRRALLVGINDYPNDGDKLEGCVNDVFEMSAVLQECGFPPESIRVCLDDRATAQGIYERLEWLLDDPQPDDERVFYYSGHGATVPVYGDSYEPDRLMETLVPWDFDWSPETAISDDQIFALYSQLPYDMRLAMIFDCCHSGGIHRDGGAKSRGINPPDDIRHRNIEWDVKSQMWVERGFNKLNDKFSSKSKMNEQYFGSNGNMVKLGRASMLRGQSEAEYKKQKTKDQNIIGPYLPLIIEACAEHELSYEYRHGVTSYGAFTFALKTQLREVKGDITFEKLIAKTSTVLKKLGYSQSPQILGPEEIRNSQVPWLNR